ncbi:MAG: 4Fe-4S binding protein [Armatimonadetes bacterium]|jgi:ferredoxin|nr:4Fe-4S binding protein [Armatimonadota bacterium]MDI9586632.1 4Fe-4S binding protein [Acidobacteriota bacterium]
METRRVVLRFPKHLLDKPITSQLVRQFDLDFNILRADITQESEGLLIMGLTGKKADLEKGLRWAREQGVEIQPLSKDVVRNEKACTHCGACINVCPTDALTIDLETREVVFNANRCIACELCVPACPFRAMEVAF